MSDTADKVLYDLADGVATITLNDPAAMNALSQPVLDGLWDRLEQAGREARCTILTGTGRGFCAGANLTGMAPPKTSREPDAGTVLDSHYHPIINMIREHPHPLLTAVNGAAAGAGCSLALMGDMIVASETAYFLQAFRGIGLVPDAGSTFLIARSAGRVRAMEMSLLGERIPAAKALEWGLINRVAAPDALMAETRSLAQKLATGPTWALGRTRGLIWDALESSMAEALHAERIAQRTAGRRSDFREGVAAFLQKRAAKFTGD